MGRSICCKKNDKYPQTSSLFKNELTILKKLCHPHLVTLRGYFQDDNNLYLIMDYYEDGSLSNVLNIKRETISSFQDWFAEHELVFFAKQIMSAINYLHQNNYAHRDLKVINSFIFSLIIFFF